MPLIYQLGECLNELEDAQIWLAHKTPTVFITNSAEAREVLDLAGIVYDGEIQLEKVGFCKMETQQECMAGTLYIPKLSDVLGERYQVMFFVNRYNIVIVDDGNFSRRLVKRIKRKRTNQGETKERFIYNFIAEFMSRDLELLAQYEKKLLRMEDEVMHGDIEDFQSELMPMRRKLLILRGGYYDEIMDACKELEDNENNFFAKKQLKYFGTLSDRADRLMGRTIHLLDYAQQVKDAYQAQIDAKQNSNMQFLTVISTIFFPLTLITGWYGMNFQNMPELANGYPGVIILSLIVVGICIFIFKKKDIF